jgi:hypothetical protein
VIVRHQRESVSNQGFRQLARYIRGRANNPRATWFRAANLPGVSRTDDLELACRLVEAVQARNIRTGSKRMSIRTVEITMSKAPPTNAVCFRLSNSLAV